MHALHACERIMVGAPDSDGPVLLVLDLHIRGEEGGRPMVLRPVELNSARDPRTCQSNKRGLDDVVPVAHVVVGNLVVDDMDAPSQLGQDHDAKPPVLEVYRLPLVLNRIVTDPLVERERIHPTR